MDLRRVDHHVYTLKPRAGTGRERTGALLRLEFTDGSSGYADCHPWVELGDQALAEQLEGLRANVLTPLTRRSLIFARADAEARSRGASLFRDLTVPKSHAFLGEAESVRPERLPALREAGFDRAKVKVHRAGAEVLDALAGLGPELQRTGIRLRLDFNQTLSVEALEAFLVSLLDRGFRPELVDWLEDPSRGSTAEWSGVRSRFGIRLAQDRAPGPVTDVRVLKPAVQEPVADAHALCVTSYLDHPVGQVCAAWCASTLARSLPLEACGLVSHEAYEKNSFSERFGSMSPVLGIPSGSGLGFDDLLARTLWEPL